MKKTLLSAVTASTALVALTGCEVPALQQRKVLDSMVGKNEVDVVRAFGVPSRSFQAQGHTFLAYVRNSVEYSGGGWSGGAGWGWGGWGPGWGGGWGGGWGPGWGWGTSLPSTAYNLNCQTSFELVNGRVVGWILRGDGC